MWNKDFHRSQRRELITSGWTTRNNKVYQIEKIFLKETCIGMQNKDDRL